uniref:G-protein coupled receptors family 1 profile domain-containing protein n=1 Tax=Amazona collaria TaxID=241587 RepID=A0A8B9FV07_9PSIT
MHNSTAETLLMAGMWNETRSTQSASSEFSLGVLVLLSFLMVFLALVTILGNALVILAFIMDRNLRHRSNYYFLNLAISDFAVCSACLSISLTRKWHLGRGVCKLWLVMDYLLCTASVFSVVLISYDCFLSVTKAVSCRTQQGITTNPVIKMTSAMLSSSVTGSSSCAHPAWSCSCRCSCGVAAPRTVNIQGPVPCPGDPDCH